MLFYTPSLRHPWSKWEFRLICCFFFSLGSMFGRRTHCHLGQTRPTPPSTLSLSWSFGANKNVFLSINYSFQLGKFAQKKKTFAHILTQTHVVRTYISYSMSRTVGQPPSDDKLFLKRMACEMWVNGVGICVRWMWVRRTHIVFRLSGFIWSKTIPSCIR